MDVSEPTPLPGIDADARESADPGSEESVVRALVERAQAGDMEAWSRLYQDHFDQLFRHLRYLTGCPQTTEELVQETFAQALCSISAYDGRSRFSTWLHGVGLNVTRHHWRAQRSTAKAHAKLSSTQEVREQLGTPTPDQAMLTRQRVQALYEALEQLPEHLREAFVLRDLQGLSPAEAADAIGITANNLAVRASRARSRIRKLLRGVEGGERR